MTENRMKQFKNLKEKYSDALLLFRCGDFYESYKEDAATVANACGLTLTKYKDGTLLTAFPHFSLDTYLPKLIRAGHRVAFCNELKEREAQ